MNRKGIVWALALVMVIWSAVGKADAPRGAIVTVSSGTMFDGGRGSFQASTRRAARLARYQAEFEKGLTDLKSPDRKRQAQGLEWLEWLVCPEYDGDPEQFRSYVLKGLREKAPNIPKGSKVVRDSSGKSECVLNASAALGRVGLPEDIPALREVMKLGDQGQPPDGYFLAYASQAAFAIRDIKTRAEMRERLKGMGVKSRVEYMVAAFREYRDMQDNALDFAAQQLTRIGKPAVKPLIQLLDDGIEGKIRDGWGPIGNLVPRILLVIGDPEAIGVLKRLLAYHHRYMGPRSITIVGLQAAIAELEEQSGK